MRNRELNDAWFQRQDDGSEGIIFVIIQELTNSPGGRELPFWLLSQQGRVSSCLTKVTTYLRSLLKASLPLREKPAGPDPYFRNIGIAQGREQCVPSWGTDVISCHREGQVSHLLYGSFGHYSWNSVQVQAWMLSLPSSSSFSPCISTTASAQSKWKQHCCL